MVATPAPPHSIISHSIHVCWFYPAYSPIYIYSYFLFSIIFPLDHYIPPFSCKQPPVCVWMRNILHWFSERQTMAAMTFQHLFFLFHHDFAMGNLTPAMTSRRLSRCPPSLRWRCRGSPSPAAACDGSNSWRQKRCQWLDLRWCFNIFYPLVN